MAYGGGVMRGNGARGAEMETSILRQPSANPIVICNGIALGNFFAHFARGGNQVPPVRVYIILESAGGVYAHACLPSGPPSAKTLVEFYWRLNYWRLNL